MVCEIDGSACSLGCWCLACSLQVLFQLLVTVWAQFCKILGRVLGGVQFGVRVQVLFEVVVTLWTWLRDRRVCAREHAVSGGGAGAVEVLVTVWAYFRKIEGRVLGGMQFEVLVQVLLSCFGVLIGCCLRCWCSCAHVY